ncbi:MAG: site-specific integrase [Firmicutes bacterium]|nr:site-specific integrase [Bacillota bacterium]
MPPKISPEFTWDARSQSYRKKIKNPLTGKWTDVYGKTKAELREKLRAREAEYQLLTQPERLLVWQYAAQWYKLNTAGLSAKRREDYKNAVNNHICPVIGQRVLQDIKPDDIKAVMLAASGLSKSGQQKIVTTLKRLFAAAEDNDLIKRSPCRDLKAGGAPSKEKVPLTKAQQSALLSAVSGCAVEPFVYLCLYAGLRRGEALGLQWDCVYLTQTPPYLEVKRTLRWEGKNTPVVDSSLKSKASQRKIPLPPQLFDCLSSLQSARKKEKPELYESPFVVCNQSGGPVSATGFRKMWDAVRIRSVREGYALGDKVRNHPILVTLDFHVTPHQLRHTYITELIMSGASIKTVQYLAGHATVQLTLNIYTHLMANTPADTMPAISKAFSPPAVTHQVKKYRLKRL